MEEQNSTKSSIATSEYCGEIDEKGQRTGIGTQTWEANYHQRYSGSFLNDTLHGRGQYLWSSNGKNTFYDGLFYANTLEGYGKFSFGDLNSFEGLFRNNQRFGPGVYSYLDGSQDVGLWWGKDLARLCRTVKPEWVPRIAKSSLAKVILLRYKTLVRVYNEIPDRAKNILMALGANEDVLKQSDKLYNLHIGNPASHFFNSVLFEKGFFCEKDCCIEVALDAEETMAYYTKKDQEERERPQQRSEIPPQEQDCCRMTDTFEEKEGSEQFPTKTASDIACLCQNDVRVRNEWLKSEIERTDEFLAKIEVQIACLKRREKKLRKQLKASHDGLQRSVVWEKVEIINAHMQDFPAENKADGDHKEPVDVEEIKIRELKGEQEESLSDKEQGGTECAEEEEMSYDDACKKLEEALHLRTNLQNKRSNLIAKIESNVEKDDAESVLIEQPPTKLVMITDLLAWNNERISMEMLKHVFLHRNFENDMTYSVARLVSGDRSEFRKSGSYEEDCVNFLKECSNGNVKEALELIRKRDLYPDLCDSKGNTGIIYATARDKVRIIKMLINLGANLDVFNDECLTPLSMCVARYLAVQNKVTNWEEAFLKTTTIDAEEENEVRVWRPHTSLCSLTTISQSKSDVLTDNATKERRSSLSDRKSFVATSEAFSDFIKSSIELNQSEISAMDRIRTMKISNADFQGMYIHRDVSDQPQLYMFNTDCVKPPPKPAKAKKAKKGKKGKSSKKSSKSSGSRKSKKTEPVPLGESPVDQLAEGVRCSNQLDAIHNTMITLLNYGADPNLGEVPLPMIIMAVFTRNSCIVKDLLRCKADPNVRTLDEGLTPLHVLVSLSPCEEFLKILKVLLENSGDPNANANQNHWIEEKQKLIRNHALIGEDEGKTPLHLLSMRYDYASDSNSYLNQMVPIFMEYGGKVKQRYLGHTPLSLAVLRGNIKLIRALLDTRRINPNQLLGENIGFPLTVLILKRYADVLPVKTCQEVFQTLLEYSANPFNDTEVYGNAIDFMIKEHEPLPSEAGKKKDKKGKKDKKESKKKTKDKKTKDKKAKSTQNEVKQLLLDCGRTVLENHIKGWAVRYLYFFVEEEDFYDDISENMAKFVTPEETLRIAQLLFYRGEIPIDEEKNYDTMYDLLEFIINIHSMLKGGPVTLSQDIDIDRILSHFDFRTIPKEKGKLNLIEPEAEPHQEKYNVCFNCYRKKDVHLFICPDCRLVYFCSQECNVKNNHVKDVLHKCGSLFYNRQKEIHEERLRRVDEWRRYSDFATLFPEFMKGAQLSPVPTEEFFGPHEKKFIQPDERRRLHLTRHLREKHGKVSLEAFTRQLHAGHPDIKTLGDPSHSLLSDRWMKQGSQFLTWKGSATGTERTGKASKGTKMYGDDLCQADRHRRKDSRSAKKGGRKGRSASEESSEIKGGAKGRKTSKRKEEETGEGGRGARSGMPGKGEKLLRGARGQMGAEDGAGKGIGRFTGAGAGLALQARITEGFEKFGKAELDSGPGIERPKGFVPFPFGGAAYELRHRLPNKYQYFLERISELWPDFDLSLLFLPYACFSDGQLYYRFLSNRPVFLETYSNH